MLRAAIDECGLDREFSNYGIAGGNTLAYHAGDHSNGNRERERYEQWRAVAGSAPWNRALDRVPLISGSNAGSMNQVEAVFCIFLTLTRRPRMISNACFDTTSFEEGDPKVCFPKENPR